MRLDEPSPAQGVSLQGKSGTALSYRYEGVISPPPPAEAMLDRANQGMEYGVWLVQPALMLPISAQSYKSFSPAALRTNRM